MKALPIRGILAVTATYLYFLLYAQFGFLVAWMERDVGGAARAGSRGRPGDRPSRRAKAQREAVH